MMLHRIIRRTEAAVLHRPLFCAALLQAVVLAIVSVISPEALLPKLPVRNGEQILLAGIAGETRPVKDGVRVTLYDGRYLSAETGLDELADGEPKNKKLTGKILAHKNLADEKTADREETPDNRDVSFSLYRKFRFLEAQKQTHVHRTHVRS